MPFQPPVRPDSTRMRASGKALAAGKVCVLDQSASRKLRGRSSNENKAARAATGIRKSARRKKITGFRRKSRAGDGNEFMAVGGRGGFRRNRGKQQPCKSLI